MSNHTPGPWTMTKQEDVRACGAVRSATNIDGTVDGFERHGDGNLVATTHTPRSTLAKSPEQQERLRAANEANARLIAAAPDLLALALRVVETATVCRDCEWEVLNHELVQLLTSLESEAREAINKAGGAR